MSGAIQATIAADSSADLLCRLIGLFAQRDLAAPGMTVDITGREMIVTIDLTDLDGRTVSLLAAKMARCIGVEAVTIDSTPIAHLAPAQRMPVG